MRCSDEKASGVAGWVAWKGGTRVRQTMPPVAELGITVIAYRHSPVASLKQGLSGRVGQARQL